MLGEEEEGLPWAAPETAKLQGLVWPFWFNE